MTGKLRDMLPLSGGEWLVSFTTRSNPGELFDRFRDAEVAIDIKKAGKGRSKDANAMCWALCSDIGKAFTPPRAKEDVYRDAIKAVGVFTPVIVTNWDIETVRRRWAEKGVGWFAEVADADSVGHTWVNLYYGTSAYSVDEMRLVLDWLIDQAEQMQISIPLSKADEEEMLERWGAR